MPDGEFTIGPLTFRVLYRYEGTLAAVPQPFYADEIPAADEAGPVVVPAPDPSVPPYMESPLPEAGSGDSIDGVIVAMPDLMALADAEVEEILPDAEIEALLPPAPLPPGPSWSPPAYAGPGAAPTMDVFDAPVEIDSSLQSGGHRKSSPWSSDPPDLQKPPALPVVSRRKCRRRRRKHCKRLPPSRPPKRKRGPQNQRSRRSRRKATTWIPNSAASWKGSNKIHTVLVPGPAVLE